MKCVAVADLGQHIGDVLAAMTGWQSKLPVLIDCAKIRAAYDAGFADSALK